MSSLEKRFQAELEESCEICKTKYNYNPTAFKLMMAKSGAVEAAKQLLRSTQWQTGFGKLCEIKRLDLSVENHVSKPEYESLFTEEEIAEARKRLDVCDHFGR